MSYIVLARKYRPQTFKDIVGQEAVVQTLQNAIKNGKVGQAYLFAGPRGVGKTTAARIFAKAVNCEKGIQAEPCNECDTCREIMQGTALDVLEIDGASNRGIDEIRVLRENVKFAPAYTHYKIYIIDEVHQVTDAGFNALLKTLEEPPAQVIFIFATTEPHTIPETILSRCQRFNFRLLSVPEIVRQLQDIVKKEKIEVTTEALTLIGQAAAGSMRDGLSILDQIISFIGSEAKIDEIKARSVLGITSQELLREFSRAILRHEPLTALALITKAQETGINLVRLTKDLRLHFRNLLMAKISKEPADLIDLAKEEISELRQQTEQTSQESLLHCLEIMAGLENEIKYTDQPRIVLELGVVKLARPYVALDELVNRLERLENGSALNPSPSCKEETEEQTPLKMDSKNTSFWTALVEAVREQKPTLAVCLESAVNNSVEEQTLTLEFLPQNNFQKQTVERADNSKIVEEVAAKIMQKKIKVRTAVRPSSESTAKPASGGAATPENLSPGKAKAATFVREPLVEKALHIFEGEIISSKTKQEER